MIILYRQPIRCEDPGSMFLEKLGVKQCYFKHLYTQKDAEIITNKRHHHTHYELHIMESGLASYESESGFYTLKSGHFLLLPPRHPHRNITREPGTSTLSITFNIDESKGYLENISRCVVGTIPEDILYQVRCVLSEYGQSRPASSQMIAASLAQILIRFWRECGAKSKAFPQQLTDDDPRLTLAIQYILDNIEYSPTVSEVSTYCHLSTKHLTRLFTSIKNVTPSDFIRSERVKHIEALLKMPELSLKAISERMHFSSEYYFNTFFKSQAGMTPGEFRRMHKVST